MADISRAVDSEGVKASEAFGNTRSASVARVVPAPYLTARALWMAGLGPEATAEWWEAGTLSAAALASAGLA